MSTITERVIDTPVGPMRLAATDAGLTAADFVDRRPARAAAPSRPHPVLDLAERELTGYFAGTLRAFTIPLAPRGTAFQRAVWAALAALPYGETRSYSEIARAVGRPRAVRAVGAANGRNEIAVIVPCHRVIGADGTLTGYAGGLPRKHWLLRHERHPHVS